MSTFFLIFHKCCLFYNEKVDVYSIHSLQKLEITYVLKKRKIFHDVDISRVTQIFTTSAINNEINFQVLKNYHYR